MNRALPGVGATVGWAEAGKLPPMGILSAGILLYRRCGNRLEVFLVHPGGPFWEKKDRHAWSIPKGVVGEGEGHLAAALREFAEETGQPAPRGPYIALPPRRQAGGKTILAFAAEGDADPGAIRSNRFAMEWPPGTGRQQMFPEVDRAGWFSLAAAREKLFKGQVGLLDDLEHWIPPAPR